MLDRPRSITVARRRGGARGTTVRAAAVPASLRSLHHWRSFVPGPSRLIGLIRHYCAPGHAGALVGNTEHAESLYRGRVYRRRPPRDLRSGGRRGGGEESPHGQFAGSLIRFRTLASNATFPDSSPPPAQPFVFVVQRASRVRGFSRENFVSIFSNRVGARSRGGARSVRIAPVRHKRSSNRVSRKGKRQRTAERREGDLFLCCMVKSHYRATKFDMVFTLVARRTRERSPIIISTSITPVRQWPARLRLED